MGASAFDGGSVMVLGRISLAGKSKACHHQRLYEDEILQQAVIPLSSKSGNKPSSGEDGMPCLKSSS